MFTAQNLTASLSGVTDDAFCVKKAMKMTFPAHTASPRAEER